MVALSTLMVPIGILNLASVVFGGALPINIVARNSELITRSCNPDPPTVPDGAFGTVQLVNNATSLFAWQLTATTQYVGSDDDKNSLAHVVGDIRDNGQAYLQRTGFVGLYPDIITTMVSGRFGCGINQDTDNNVAHIIKYARLVFTTQLSYIFTDIPTAFTVLCDNLDHERLQMIYGIQTEADTLYNWVCSRSATKQPTKSIQDTIIPLALQLDLYDSVSQIFATELLGVLSTDTVKTACGKDWDAFAANLSKSKLVPDAFKKTFCTSDTQKAMSDHYRLTDQISALATHTIVAQLFALSGEHDLQEFLCHKSNYNEGGILSVGLLKDRFYNEVTQRCKGFGMNLDA